MCYSNIILPKFSDDFLQIIVHFDDLFQRLLTDKSYFSDFLGVKGG